MSVVLPIACDGHLRRIKYAGKPRVGFHPTKKLCGIRQTDVFDLAP